MSVFSGTNCYEICANFKVASLHKLQQPVDEACTPLDVVTQASINLYHTHARSMLDHQFLAQRSLLLLCTIS